MMEESTQTNNVVEITKRKKADQKVLTYIHQKKSKNEQDRELD